MIELSNELGLAVSPMELETMARQQKKREADCEIRTSEKEKMRRRQRKVFRHVRMGKEDAKKCHRSEKLSYKHSCKSFVKSQRTCGKCKQKGHNARICLMPKLEKRGKVELFDWHPEVDPDLLEMAHKKMRRSKSPELFDW